MKRVIKVRQVHIDRGVKKCVRSCPIALAMYESGLNDPLVCDETVSWYVGDQRSVNFPTPKCARAFIEQFDQGSQVDPFEFTVEDAATA